MLIDELKKEHAQIADVLGRMRDAGITSKEGQMLLSSARDSLLAHLQKEDKHLYPVLKAAAEHDADLKRTMDIFAKDMQAISEAVMGFFRKYESGGSGIEFAKDFGRLFTTLSSRINKEESVLYEAYQRITSTNFKASA